MGKFDKKGGGEFDKFGGGGGIDKYTFFLNGFCAKREQNMRLQTDFDGKPNIIERQILQNVTFFILGTACFFNRFLDKKRTKREV